MQSGCTLSFDKQKLIDDIANLLVIKLKDKLNILDKNVFGELIDSIEYSKEEKLVGSKSEVAKPVEYGRRAGKHVPIQPLLEWVYVKLNIYGKEAEDMAYAIERKIFNEGIPKTRFAKLTLSEFENQ